MDVYICVANCYVLLHEKLCMRTIDTLKIFDGMLGVFEFPTGFGFIRVRQSLGL